VKKTFSGHLLSCSSDPQTRAGQSLAHQTQFAIHKHILVRPVIWNDGLVADCFNGMCDVIFLFPVQFYVVVWVWMKSARKDNIWRGVAMYITLIM